MKVQYHEKKFEIFEIYQVYKKLSHFIKYTIVQNKPLEMVFSEYFRTGL